MGRSIQLTLQQQQENNVGGAIDRWYVTLRGPNKGMKNLKAKKMHRSIFSFWICKADMICRKDEAKFDCFHVRYHSITADVNRMTPKEKL